MAKEKNIKVLTLAVFGLLISIIIVLAGALLSAEQIVIDQFREIIGMTESFSNTIGIILIALGFMYGLFIILYTRFKR